MRDGFLALYVDRIEAVPTPCLSPNGRCHWKARNRDAQLLREAARLAARDAMARKNWAKPVPQEGDLAMRWTVFWGKGEKRRDLDNLIGGPLKPAQDGIFDALGMNDTRVVQISVDQRRALDGRGWMQLAVVALDEETEA